MTEGFAEEALYPLAVSCALRVLQSGLRSVPGSERVRDHMQELALSYFEAARAANEKTPGNPLDDGVFAVPESVQRIRDGLLAAWTKA